MSMTNQKRSEPPRDGAQEMARAADPGLRLLLNEMLALSRILPCAGREKARAEKASSDDLFDNLPV